jgi:hypothetical protein
MRLQLQRVELQSRGDLAAISLRQCHVEAVPQRRMRLVVWSVHRVDDAERFFPAFWR